MPIEIGIPSRVKQRTGRREAFLVPILPQRKPIGRPTVMTADVVQKLEDAFMNAFSDKEAALYAGISERTLHYYCKQNPEFLQRKETLKLSPNLLAKKELVAGIKGNLDQARWWAQHRMSGDFNTKTKVEMTGDMHTTTADIPPERLNEIVKKYEAELYEEIAKNRPDEPDVI